MKILIIAVLMSVLLFHCGHYKNTSDRHQILTICNRWDRDICFEDGDFTGGLVDYNPLRHSERFYIKSGDCCDDFDEDFENVLFRYDSNRLTYYFFDVEVLRTVPWDTVFKYKMYLDVRHYTKAVLDSLDWRIVYP